MIGITSEIQDLYSEVRSKDINREKSVWLEEPVDFKTFNESPLYLNAFPLSERQYHDVMQVLGSDPKKVFSPDRDYSLAVFLWAKGAGKDLTVSRIFAYVLYILLCMRSPQQYLWGTNRTAHMDLLNVAKKGKQARDIFFNYLRQVIVSSPWFTSNFTIRESNKLLSKPVAPRDSIDVGITSIEVRKANIRAYAETSAASGLEGYSPLIWVLDEASAFVSAAEVENAHEIFRTLNTSGRSRAGKNFKPLGFVISYPRKSENDLTLDLYNKSFEDNEIYGSFGWSWQIKPAYLYSGETFQFRHPRIGKMFFGEEVDASIDIPIELREDFMSDFEDDPTDALSKHLCVPPSVAGQWALYPELFWNCLNESRKNIIETESFVVDEWNENSQSWDKRLKLRLKSFNLTHVEAKNIEFVVWLDNAETNADAVIAVGHKEYREDNLVLVQDANLVWSPDKANNIKVSLKDVEDWLVNKLPDLLNVVAIGSDYWNALSIGEDIRTKHPHIRVVQSNLNNSDFAMLEGLVYKGQFETPFASVVGQLTHLKKGNTVPIPGEGFKKDQADGATGIAKLSMSAAGQRASNLSTAPRPEIVVLPKAANLFSRESNPFSGLQESRTGQVGVENRFVEAKDIQKALGIRTPQHTRQNGKSKDKGITRLPTSIKL